MGSVAPTIDFNQFEIVREDTFTLNKPANDEEVTDTVAHGFDKPPIVLGWANSTLDPILNLNSLPDVRVSTSSSLEGPGLVTYNAGIYVSALLIEFFIYTPDVGGSPLGPYSSEFDITFNYYILRETAELELSS